jgi:leucyl aminopeptidase (aminopeptidase T)
MDHLVEDGAKNCVIDCARVKKGSQVYVVNQKGAVAEEVSHAIEEIVERENAKAITVWEEAIPKGSDKIPPNVLEAFTTGDVVISHYPSLKREVLHPHVQRDTRSRATNRAVSRELLQSEWARFPYGLLLTIIGTLDTILADGKEWRITSPKGTDVKGKIGGIESAVAQAYFARGEDDSRASRNFPGGVHTPVMSTETEGVIVVDHANVRGGFRPAEPIRIELKDSKVTSIRGGDDAATIIKELEKTDGYLDSWHAGANPKTILPVKREDDASAWWTYAHCSPMLLHFHLGRSHAPVNVATFNQTVYVDGRKIYDGGALALLEEAEVEKTARKFGAPSSLLSQHRIDLS